METRTRQAKVHAACRRTEKHANAGSRLKYIIESSTYEVEDADRDTLIMVVWDRLL